MKDILIGLVIIICGFLIIDFIYTEKNTCVIDKPGYTADYAKCGIIKEKMNIDINLFNRYW